MTQADRADPDRRRGGSTAAALPMAPRGRWGWFMAPATALSLLLSLLLLSVPVRAEPAVDADAETVMRALADYFGRLQAFTVSYETDGEFLDGNGQKLMSVASGEIAMRRPDRIHVTRHNFQREATITYDGAMLSIFAKATASAYFQLAVAGTVDGAIDAIRSDIGYDMPGADLLAADVYASLMGNVTSGQHLGMAVIDGIECHHLAFRTDVADWQLWVAAGDQPLPLRYVITTKWVTGAPQYTARLRNWHVAPQIDDSVFVFTPPADARQIEGLRVNAIGELEEVTP